ncbi:MAG: hypothetical protein FD177_228 [Desulfovibrionaceae bacterium]|nr:MAG: hypothetical protein FD177_228 [Desulfovibrionaceae bacterium]
MGRVVTIPYSPRPLQRELHRNRKRFTVLVCHRRFGKTVWGINELLKDACTKVCKNYRGAYLAPLLKQAKQVAWDYLKEYAGAIPGASFNESELRCDLPNGARIMLLGADNPDAIRGMYLDGVVLDEVAQMPRNLWGQVIRPLLSDRDGWCVFIGTPKGHNFFWEQYQRGLAGDDPEWMSRMFRASETALIASSELASARKDMTEEEYAQEYECSFTAAILGAYYGKLLALADADKRICRIPYESTSRVNTYWDLGISDAMTIWFVQQVGKEIRFIDYYESSGAGLDHYIQVLDRKGYLYGDHFAPHDIKVRELGSGKSRLEIARGLGLSFKIAPNIGVMDGINAARMILSRCWFDSERCRHGLEALRQYRSEYDEKKRIFSSQPLHDWTSHAADAFRMFAVSWQEQATREFHHVQSIANYNPLDGLQQQATSYDVFGEAR